MRALRGARGGFGEGARPCVAARPVYDLGSLRTRAVMRDTPPVLMCGASARRLRLVSRTARPSGGMADAGDSKDGGPRAGPPFCAPVLSRYDPTDPKVRRCPATKR